MTPSFGGNVSLTDFSMEDIAEVAKKVFKNYPYPSESNNYNVNFKMIKRDFPNLNERDIMRNEASVERYYDVNLDYEVLQILKKTKKPKKKRDEILRNDIGEKESSDISSGGGGGGKSSSSGSSGSSGSVSSGSGGGGGSSSSSSVSSYDPNCTTQMSGYATDILKYACVAAKISIYGYSWNPLKTRYNYSRAAYSLVCSRREAEGEFGTSEDNTKDAKRHIYLSALLALNYFTISSKLDRLNFAKVVGDANEECGANKTDAAQMDYHNNAIGRDLFSNNTSYKTYSILWGAVTITYGLNLPSTTTLKNKTISLVNNQKFHVDTTGVKPPIPKQDVICWRKHKIKQTDSSKPVHLK